MKKFIDSDAKIIPKSKHRLVGIERMNLEAKVQTSFIFVDNKFKISYVEKNLVFWDEVDCGEVKSGEIFVSRIYTF